MVTITTAYRCRSVEPYWFSGWVLIRVDLFAAPTIYSMINDVVFRNPLNNLGVIPGKLAMAGAPGINQLLDTASSMPRRALASFCNCSSSYGLLFLGSQLYFGCIDADTEKRMIFCYASPVARGALHRYWQPVALSRWRSGRPCRSGFGGSCFSRRSGPARS
jgi:hypothetical protein